MRGDARRLATTLITFGPDGRPTMRRVRERLRWSPTRLLEAMADLERAGLLVRRVLAEVRR